MVGRLRVPLRVSPMTRFPSLAVRTLTRARIRRPMLPGRTAKLRLDTLEDREQPGSVISGLASGAVLDPLAAMALAVGEVALRGPLSTVPVAAEPRPAEPSSIADPLASSASPPPSPGTPAGDGPSSGPADPEPVNFPVSTDALDPALVDPTRFAVPVLSMDGVGSGTSGGPASTTSSFLPAGS